MNFSGMQLDTINPRNVTVTARNTSAELPISRLNFILFEAVYLPSFIYICVMLIVGIPGNALVCYIYQFKIRNKQLSSNIFILALSWFDLINCIISLPTELKITLDPVQFDAPLLCKISRFITFFCNNASSVILLAIAVDRLVAFLSGPVRRRLKQNMAKIIVVVAICISASLSWPMLLFFGTYNFELKNGIVLKSCRITNDYVKSKAVEIFTIVLLSLNLVFDFAFFVIYSIIGKKICNELKFTQQGNSRNFYSAKVELGRIDGVTSDELFIENDDLSDSRSSSTSRMAVKKNNTTDTLLLSNQDLLLHVSQMDPSENGVTRVGDSPIGLSSDVNTEILQSSGTFLNVKTSQRKCRLGRWLTSTSSECKIFNRRTTACKTSFMLFLVTVAYVLSFVPYCVLVVLAHTSKASVYEDMNQTEKAFFQLFLRSYVLSSAINPIIYSLVNKSFRDKCKVVMSGLLLQRVRRNLTNL